MDTAWIALIGTLFGGVALKVLESYFTRAGKKIDLATDLRTELRTESQHLKEEIRAAEKDLDQWKEKYFTLLQEFLELKARDGPVQKEKKGGEDW